MSKRLSFNTNKAQSIHLSHISAHVTSQNLEPLASSFIPPHAYWSAGEKAAFFLSLARHSRWRPDIIAEDIGGGKGVSDVCSYIELLEQCVVREGGTDERSRDALPGAHEVSEEWIEVEESMAGLLYQQEESWQEAALKRKRDELVKDLRKRLRAEDGAAKEDDQEVNSTPATTSKRKLSSSDQGEQDAWQERFKNRKQELAALWKQENTLASLDRKCLKTLDTMIRALDAAEQNNELEASIRAAEGTTRRSSVTPIAAPTVPCSSDPRIVESVDTRRSNPMRVNTLDNPEIDPSLLALDTASGRTPTAAQDTPENAIASSFNSELQSTLPVVSSPHFSSLHNTSPGPSRPSISRTSHPFSPLRSLNVPYTSPSHDPPTLPPDLSPAARQRLRKRLWTRRKRAMLTGLPASEVSADFRKLKPGRKGISKNKKAVSVSNDEVNRISEELQDREPAGAASMPKEDDGDATDGSETVRKRNHPGWAKFVAVGVDGAFLRTQGIDLFCLTKVGAMASLIQNVSKPPAESNEAIEDNSCGEPDSALSYSFLRLLRAHLVHFITRLIAKVIAQKQIETQQKKRIKGIFKTGGALEVNSDNVREALMIMGQEPTNKRFFKRLKRAAQLAGIGDAESVPSKGRASRRHNKGKSIEAIDPDDSEDFNDGSESDTTDESDSRDSAHPPSVLPTSKFSTHSSLELYWNPDTLAHNQSDDALLPEFTDEEAVKKDLKAEEKVDSVDREADVKHEDLLWVELGVSRDITGGALGAGTSTGKTRGKAPSEDTYVVHGSNEGQGARSLRFRKPRVKSRIYIDSDEDV